MHPVASEIHRADNPAAEAQADEVDATMALIGARITCEGHSLPYRLAEPSPPSAVVVSETSTSHDASYESWDLETSQQLGLRPVVGSWHNDLSYEAWDEQTSSSPTLVAVAAELANDESYELWDAETSLRLGMQPVAAIAAVEDPYAAFDDEPTVASVELGHDVASAFKAAAVTALLSDDQYEDDDYE